MTTLPNESSRMRLPIDIHQHGAPGDGGAPGVPMLTRPDGTEPSAGGHAGRLWREKGRVLYAGAKPAGGDAGAGGGADGDPGSVAVRIVWALPLSGRGGAVSVLQAGKKREIAYLSSLDELDPASRRVAEEELAAGMVMPVITAVHSVRQRFGNYYWDVETDRGRKKFLLSSPETNSLRPAEDTVVIRDVSGNCYEIASVEGLDRSSRNAVERVL